MFKSQFNFYQNNILPHLTISVSSSTLFSSNETDTELAGFDFAKPTRTFSPQPAKLYLSDDEYLATSKDNLNSVLVRESKLKASELIFPPRSECFPNAT